MWDKGFFVGEERYSLPLYYLWDSRLKEEASS